MEYCRFKGKMIKVEGDPVEFAQMILGKRGYSLNPVDYSSPILQLVETRPHEYFYKNGCLYFIKLTQQPKEGMFFKARIKNDDSIEFDINFNPVQITLTNALDYAIHNMENGLCKF